MIARIYGVIGLILLLALMLVGYRVLEANMRADIYHDRLIELGAYYETLRNRYNDAVRRTAVTELLVEDGSITVLVRGMDGEIRRIPTELDPTREVYVDYVVIDGRLWIRRMFDQRTPPDQAVVIDPDFANVDWDQPGVDHGKAVYRRLHDGRWIVTVTGDGSLGLRRMEPGMPDMKLMPAPEIREYEELEEAMHQELSTMRWSDVMRRMFSSR